MNSVPTLNRQFFCIVNRKETVLAAVVASYIYSKTSYTPIFEMAGCTVAKNEKIDTSNQNSADSINEHGMSRARADETSVYINNALVALGSDAIENVIFVGLTPEQKSYLEFPSSTNIIEINDLDEVYFMLSSFESEEKQILPCREEQILEGLAVAQRNGWWLRVDVSADIIDLPSRLDGNRGIIVIEDDFSTSPVIAVHYASCVDADVQLVKKIDRNGKKDIEQLLLQWGQKEEIDEDKADAVLNEISEIVNNRIGLFDFSHYLYVTYFTVGIPYTLVTKNSIPSSYVHLQARPDFFIYRSILAENAQIVGSAVIFNPNFLIKNEINFVEKTLSDKNYDIKKIFGKNATERNLSMAIEYYPYDLFHICTHGGRAKGNIVELAFNDSLGNSHICEYAEVVGISLVPGDKLFRVNAKVFPLKLNGNPYSQEVYAASYPRTIGADLYNAAFRASVRQKKYLHKNVEINGSCYILCKDTIHQGMINNLANGEHPVIFNNSCFSWGEIALGFLNSGCRGYIGSLWNVGNSVAAAFANKFYENCFSMPVMNAIHLANPECDGTNSENTYIYWGLHFTSLKTAVSKIESKRNVCKSLFFNYRLWQSKSLSLQDRKIKESIKDILSWLLTELRNYKPRK
ncbi:hypothetical protein [Chitinophaga sp. HK235]|uniref:hypothetical protein n=1 Tax=Chitinophaga sp. HK235 TaxID=2952571 RepID=UPI001BA617A9|nr:hypothetical protein [Chitinophaga sp. HK235]